MKDVGTLLPLPMDSTLPTPPPRQSRLTAAGTSLAIHCAVIALLLLFGGPVWEQAARPRTVTKLAAPPRPRPPVMVRVSRVRAPRIWEERPQLAQLPIAAPTPSPATRPTAIPDPVTRPTLRIEVPEMTPAPVVPALASALVSALVSAPTAIMPQVTVKPLVQVGLLESPASPGVVTKKAVAASAGFEAGTGSQPANRRRQVSAGFDDGVAGRAAARAPTKETVASVGFDRPEAPSARAKVVTTPFEGIEILNKPKPVYTEEARRLRIEGTVQLRVVFEAAGQIRVVGVVKSLGHGLDEAAVQAAEAIRFRPARRDGHPVDAPAVIQIQFQIA